MKITLESFAADKGFTPGQLSGYGVRNGQGGIVIPYFTAEGHEYIRFQVRSDSSDGQGFRWSKGDAPLLPYGLHRPVGYEKGTLWVVEGASDCWALWTHGIPALGLPGATNIACLDLAHVAGIKTVLVIQEPGEAGSRFPTRVANRLYDLGFEGKVSAVSLDPEKDPRSLMVADPENFVDRLKAAFKARILIEPPRKANPAGVISISMADLFDMPAEEVSWLVDGLLPIGGVMILASKPKVGKTVLAKNLALSVARGKRFLGRRCEAGVVLWLALEESKDQVVTSFKAMGVDRSDPIRFHFGSAPEDAFRWLQAECEANKVALIVLDTWHKLSLIENVNDYAAVNRANAPLMRLARELNVAQIWVHHSNKGTGENGDQVLGSSALFAACDVLLTMTRANDGTRTARSIQRVGTDMEDTIIGMDEDTKTIASAGSKYVALVEIAKGLVARMLRTAFEPMTQNEIAKAVDCRRASAMAALNELIREGLVVRVSGTGKRGDPNRFQSTEGVTVPLTSPRGDSVYSVPPVVYREPREPGIESDSGTARNSLELDGTAGMETIEADGSDDLLRYADREINGI